MSRLAIRIQLEKKTWSVAVAGAGADFFGGKAGESVVWKERAIKKEPLLK